MWPPLKGPVGTKVYDVSTGVEIKRVVAVDTERGEVEVTFGRDHESKHTLRYVEVRELRHSGPRSVSVFYCYGLIRRPASAHRRQAKSHA